MMEQPQLLGLSASIWSPNNSFQFQQCPSPYRPTTTPAVTLWPCQSCGFRNSYRRTGCAQCSGGVRPGATERSLDNNGIVMGHGLSRSRWAPKKRREHRPEEIWTRINPAPTTTTITNSTLTTLDLGLPYEVQHYILSMMQRILEDACYEVTSRFLPNLLCEKGWTCPEQVELSTWRDTLPATSLPKLLQAYTVPGYSIEEGLRDATKTRNDATHRHLCDNRELRDKSVRHGWLMSCFGDVTRQRKFVWLKEVLIDWDSGVNGLDVKRRMLENALRQISERPVDDMDWTPNMVSMEQVTGGDDEDYDDRMDID